MTGANQAGQIAFTQVIKTDIQMTADDENETKWEKQMSLDGYILDGGPVQYCGEIRHVESYKTHLFDSCDWPHTELPNSLKKLSRNDTFHLYLMYKSDEPSSIWVTLCRLDWGWAALPPRMEAAFGPWFRDRATILGIQSVLSAQNYLSGKTTTITIENLVQF